MNDAPVTADSPLPALDAVVVVADSGPLLLGCVDGLLASPRVARVQVFDNASVDGIPQRLLAAHPDEPRLTLRRSDHNLGFGAAVNRAAQGLGGDCLLVLNPDALLPPDDLQRLLQAAACHPQAGMIGALIVDQEGQLDPASRRHDPTLRRVLAKLRVGHGEGVNDAAIGADAVAAVDNISGALMLLRRSAFDALGGFDEGYFLHFEDLDLCRRMRDAGYQVLLHGGVRVTHRQGSSSHHRPLFVAWHKHRGMWRWFVKHDPLARRWYARVGVFAGIWGHFALQLPRLAWRARRAAHAAEKAQRGD